MKNYVVVKYSKDFEWKQYLKKFFDETLMWTPKIDKCVRMTSADAYKLLEAIEIFNEMRKKYAIYMELKGTEYTVC